MREMKMDSREESQNSIQKDTQPIRKKRVWIIPVACSVILSIFIFILVGLVYFTSYALPKIKIQEKLNLGEKYVSEMDYENAIIVYKEALEINPKSEEAYIGLGDVYLEVASKMIEDGNEDEAKEEIEKAIKELKTGYKKTQSDLIADKIKELEEKLDEINTLPESENHIELSNEGAFEAIEQSEEEPKEYMPIDVQSLPGGLESFLDYLMWTVSEYDCESKEKTGEVVEYITAHPSSAFSDLYSDYIYVPQYEDRYSDTSFFVPMDEYGWSGYFVYDSDGIDWILKNIYNFSDERILEIKEPDFCTDTFKDENKEARKFFFYDSGKYWSFTGGIGGPGWIINIKRAEVLGNYYNVEYEVIDDYEGGSTTTRYAVMEYKIIDGKGYWSIYKDSEYQLFDFSQDIN